MDDAKVQNLFQTTDIGNKNNQCVGGRIDYI